VLLITISFSLFVFPLDLQVLGSYSDESASVSAYKRLWLPLEQAAALAADAATNRGAKSEGGVAAVLEAFLEAFLAAQPPPEADGAPGAALAAPFGMPSWVGGQLYARFRAWLGHAVASASSAGAGGAGAAGCAAVDAAVGADAAGAGRSGGPGASAATGSDAKEANVEAQLQKLADFAQAYFGAPGGGQPSSGKLPRLQPQQEQHNLLQAACGSQTGRAFALPRHGGKTMNPPPPRPKRASAALLPAHEGDESARSSIMNDSPTYMGFT
jgi:hypothetical protein